MAIAIWQIYFVPKCRHARPLPKDKFVVIVGIDTKPLGFLINTIINDWFKKDASRLASQANTLASEHSTLSYDSFVDCWELFEFDETELTQPQGTVSKTAKLSIKAAVGKSKTLIPKHKILIRDS